MNKLTSIEMRPPYLIFIGDSDDIAFAKTGAGIVQWRPELVSGQLRFEGNNVDLGVPDMTLQQAIEAGVNSLIIGVAPIGGSVGDHWVSVLCEAAKAGLDIVSGLHLRLSDYKNLRQAAEKSGARLIDVRMPANNLPIGTGRKRTGRRLLTVGTDCAVGKKYSALSISRELNNRGIKATFRATGQTGIMIAGRGVPIDSVVADFIAGAAEVVSPDNDEGHWDVIEGQGSLFNVSYSGVSLGLLHGSQPDAIVVCHDPMRKEILGNQSGVKMPSVAECIEFNLQCGRIINPDIVCVGVSVNTSRMPEGERQNYLKNLSHELGLPCIDPLDEGCSKIVEQIEKHFN